jgi:hypothetical protein
VDGLVDVQVATIIGDVILRKKIDSVNKKFTSYLPFSSIAHHTTRTHRD